MMLLNNPKRVKIGNEIYDINTDFRVALKCNKIALDKTINDTERALAIIYMLFGEKGLNCNEIEKLLELGMKYINISSNKEKSLKNDFQKDFELDFDKCTQLIRSSFKFDYNYDPYELEYLHWYDFYNDLENLSTSEFGNCCALNRITSILNQDPKEIKDNKQRDNLVKTQQELKEKYCRLKEIEMTEEQKESAKEFYKSLGIDI